MSKAIKSETITFGSTTLTAKVAPAGRGYSSDPIDVTNLTDTEEKFIPGALTKNKEFQVQAMNASGLVINTVGDVTLTISLTDGTTAATPTTVTIPNCILKDIEPPNPEAGGDRANWWTLTFQPGGGAAAASN